MKTRFLRIDYIKGIEENLGEAGYTLKQGVLESTQHEYQYYITQSYISGTRMPNKKVPKNNKKCI